MDHRTPNRRYRTISVWALAALATCVARTAAAAYFHDAHHADALNQSDWGLKARFVVSGIPRAAALPGADAMQILAAPDAAGVFEQSDGVRGGLAPCGDDGKAARRCELKWESGNLARAKGTATRKGPTLTLQSRGGQTLALRDWERCAPHGECDGERFTYLGPFGRSTYLATEIGYGHDSPTLVLFQAQTGKLLSVHYGSEAAFLSANGTLLVSSEDLNDATSLLVTDLSGEAPAIDLQCLAARSGDKSFAVAFKRWQSDGIFDVGFTETLAAKGSAAGNSRTLPVRFERGPDGVWLVMSTVDLKGAGIECRERRPSRVQVSKTKEGR